jgi:hypothetical protein
MAGILPDDPTEGGATKTPNPSRANRPRPARFIDDRSDSVSGRFSISTTRGQHHAPSSTLDASCVTRKHRAAWRRFAFITTRTARCTRKATLCYRPLATR